MEDREGENTEAPQVPEKIDFQDLSTVEHVIMGSGVPIRDDVINASRLTEYLHNGGIPEEFFSPPAADPELNQRRAGKLFGPIYGPFDMNRDETIETLGSWLPVIQLESVGDNHRTSNRWRLSLISNDNPKKQITDPDQIRESLPLNETYKGLFSIEKDMSDQNGIEGNAVLVVNTKAPTKNAPSQ